MLVNCIFPIWAGGALSFLIRHVRLPTPYHTPDIDIAASVAGMANQLHCREFDVVSWLH